jgi:hypothetical protein
MKKDTKGQDKESRSGFKSIKIGCHLLLLNIRQVKEI